MRKKNLLNKEGFNSEVEKTSGIGCLVIAVEEILLNTEIELGVGIYKEDKILKDSVELLDRVQKVRNLFNKVFDSVEVLLKDNLKKNNLLESKEETIEEKQELCNILKELGIVSRNIIIGTKYQKELTRSLIYRGLIRKSSMNEIKISHRYSLSVTEKGLEKLQLLKKELSVLG